MARIRTIKPEILEDEKTAVLSDSAFRLFTAMIFLADDHGNVRADVRWLQSQIWWAHNPPPNVLPLLVELTKPIPPLVYVYGVRGGTYAHINGWEKHQRIDNAGKNRVPLPSDPDSQNIIIDLDTLDLVSRKSSASFGEKPLDPDPDPDPEGDHDIGTRRDSRRPQTKSPRRAKSVLPAEWKPRAEERSWCVENRVQCDAEADHFRDHHTAKDSKFKDWDAAFRNWLRNAKKWSKSPTSPRGGGDGLQAVLRIANGEDA